MNIALTNPLADGWSMHGGAGWWIPMMVVMVLFWGGVIAGIFWLIRNAADGRRREAPEARKETPVEVLDRRFAEGALSPDDYRARRELLVDATAAPNGTDEDEPLAAMQTGERRQ